LLPTYFDHFGDTSKPALSSSPLLHAQISLRPALRGLILGFMRLDRLMNERTEL